MKKFLKGIVASTVIMAMALAVGCTAKPTEPTEPTDPAVADETAEASEPATGGTLLMATNAEFPPYEYYEGQDVVGIDAEIAAAIAKELGMTLEIEDMAFDAIIPSLTAGKAQIALAGMTVTPERQENVDFSDTYVKASQAIIVRADNTDITNADSLNGKTIGVQLGTTGDLFATEVTDKMERYNKGFEAVQSLKQSKIDAVVIDDQVAKALAEGNDDVKVLAEPFTTEEYAIAIKKGNTELLEKVNGALATLKENGELQKIVDKYITAE